MTDGPAHPGESLVTSLVGPYPGAFAAGGGLLFGGPADALDGVAYLGTEQLKKRGRGALELSHGAVQSVARRGGTVR